MPKQRQISGVGMGMGFAPTWLRQVSPPASQNHFNHWVGLYDGNGRKGKGGTGEGGRERVSPPSFSI